jgi:hypothetical protein
VTERYHRQAGDEVEVLDAILVPQAAAATADERQ